MVDCIVKKRDGQALSEEEIRQIIAEKLEIPEEQIKETTSFNDMQVDSLYMVEIMFSIEEMFGITIDDATGLLTVQDLCNYVENKIA